MNSRDAKIKHLKVKSTTASKNLAGSIHAFFIRDGFDEVRITAIGASAGNQATKGIAIASAFVANNANSIDVTIGFTNVYIDGVEKSAMLWRLKLS